MAQKLYRIGDAAELLSLKTYVLRYWETEFSQLRPVRTGKGQRRYTEEDVAMLDRIRYLLHDQGLTIEGARRVLAGESALSLQAAPAAAIPDQGAPAAAIPDQDAPAAAAPDQGAPSSPERENRPGKPVQLTLGGCPAGAERILPPTRRADDGRKDEIRRIADELRDLRRLLRQE